MEPGPGQSTGEGAAWFPLSARPHARHRLSTDPNQTASRVGLPVVARKASARPALAKQRSHRQHVASKQSRTCHSSWFQAMQVLSTNTMPTIAPSHRPACGRGTGIGAGWVDSSLTKHNITELTALMKTRLKRMQ